MAKLHYYVCAVNMYVAVTLPQIPGNVAKNIEKKLRYRTCIVGSIEKKLHNHTYEEVM